MLHAQGQFGYVFDEVTDGRSDTIPTTTVKELMRQFRIPRFDLAKIDIEGAEFQVFSQESDLSWCGVQASVYTYTHRFYQVGLDGHDRAGTSPSQSSVLRAHRGVAT